MVKTFRKHGEGDLHVEWCQTQICQLYNSFNEVYWFKVFFHITRSCNRTHSNQQAPLEQRVPWDLLDLSTALDASRLYESSYSSYSDKPLLVATLTAVRKNSHSLNFGWQFATLLVFRGSIWFIYYYILILISVDINDDHVFLKRELVVEHLNDCGVWYHSI